MDLTSGIVLAILIIVVAVLLSFVGCWFSLRTLRLVTSGTAIVLAVAVTIFGLAHPEYTQTNLVDSFLSGVDQVIIAVLHVFWRGKVPALGVAGRWAIAIMLLLGYRQLEAMALRRQAPELDLSAIGRGTSAGQRQGRAGGGPSRWRDSRLTTGARHSRLAAELRFRLSTMEVNAPSILPGGSRTNALASIAETSGVSGAGLVSAVLRFAGMFWPRARLYRPRIWVESGVGNRVTVLLEDVKTGLPIATKTVTGDSFDVAASMVTGYIAREIFARDRTVPRWCYGRADGRDLGAMQLVRLERFYAACPREVLVSRIKQIDILSGETGALRTAGVVRYELAQLLALDSQHLESLRLHALNRELHARFSRGRYRLAMSLEMIANPEHHLPHDEATLRKLAESLEIISRYIHPDSIIQGYAKRFRNTADQGIAGQSENGAPCAPVPQRLALQLLQVAAQELREVRTQLKLGHVMWNSFRHRDERAVWLPHRRRRHRKSFQDGVCTAELLVAIRCRLRDPAGTRHGWLKHARMCWHLRRAIRITWCIAGGPSLIYSALRTPDSKWWRLKAHKAGLDLLTRPWEHWPPWRRSTKSWQAAYNTACIYAALSDAATRRRAPATILKALEQKVITSLQNVIDNPHSELERAWDWIYSDPDFRVMRDDRAKFTEFGKFLGELEQQEYIASMRGKCLTPHLNPAGVKRTANAEPPIFSPVTSPAPIGDTEGDLTDIVLTTIS